MQKKKIIRSSTIPQSLQGLLKGQLRFLNNYFEVVGVSSEGDAVADIIANEGVRVETVNMERRISLFKDVRSVFKMYQVLRQEKPLIIHSITPKAGLVSMLAGKLAGVPIRIHTFTGLIFPYRKGLLQKILILMDRLICYCATNIYPEGEGVKKDLQKFRITSKPLEVIGNGNVNGIDVKYFNPSLFTDIELSDLKKSLGISSSDFIYIFIGRIVRDKGVSELITSFRNINLKYPNTKLLMLGNFERNLDPIPPDIEYEIDSNSSIFYLGHQSDIRPYLLMSDIFVLPTYREGFPNVVIQAGAMGLASIVTDISGCNEIIKNEENGLIIPPRDSDSLERAMIDLYLDKEKQQRLAKVARGMIVERYEQSFVWEKLLSEYKCLIDRKRK